MKMSFHTSMMMLHKAPIGESFMNTFLKKLGAIVFLFQAIEDRLKENISLYVEADIDDGFKKYGSAIDFILVDRSFHSLKELFTRIIYKAFPDADNKYKFNETLKDLAFVEEERNKYMHSAYWFLPDGKISKAKASKKTAETVFAHVDFKEMDKLISLLFDLNYIMVNYPRNAL